DHACADLQRFVQAWNLPIALAFRRQDLFDNRLPNYAGHMSLGINPGLAQRVRDADLILAVGTRLGDITTDAYRLLTPPRSQQTLVHMHVDDNELGRVYQPTLAIQTSIEAGAALLASMTPASPAPWSAWTAAARQDYLGFTKLPVLAASASGVDLGAVVDHLNTILPDDAIIANGAGNYTVWVHRFYQYRQARTELAPTSGAMGYGFPAAIAAARRHPQRTVVCFAGDGCFLMYPQELATAVQYDIPLIVIVANNGMYGTIRMHQEKRFPGRISATTLQGPDFVALAKSFGAYGELVESTDQFAAAFERARASNKPALLELRTDTRQITPGMRLA
ncbi:MAG: thiamine pyrophosphate-dependent enzyme, partial [Lacisediminimonas sp.]|nr:thiamine pyrophosphate-dependent enzyme [Lacisediminimonas sp.]